MAPWPTLAFKHLDTAGVDRVMSGHFRVGSLQYFRSFDGGPPIADPNEGIVDQFIRPADGVRFNRKQREYLSTFAFRGDPDFGGIANLSVIRVLRCPDAIVYCLSKLDHPCAMEFGGKNRIVRIIDLERFAQLIGDSIVERIPTIGLVQREYKVECGDCHYTDTPVEYGAKMPAPIYFMKRSCFSAQREIRLVWHFRLSTISPDPNKAYVDVFCPEASELCNVVV